MTHLCRWHDDTNPYSTSNLVPVSAVKGWCDKSVETFTIFLGHLCWMLPPCTFASQSLPLAAVQSLLVRPAELELPKKNKQTILTSEEFYPLTSAPLFLCWWTFRKCYILGVESLFWRTCNHKNTTQYLSIKKKTKNLYFSFSLTSQSCRLTPLARLFSWFLILFLQGINTYLKHATNGTWHCLTILQCV